MKKIIPGRVGLVAAVMVLAICPEPGILRSAESEPSTQGNLPKELTLDLGGGAKMELVLIPAGKFLMGSPPTEAKRDNDETRHEVTISRPFYMGKYLVTQEQYEKVTGRNPSKFKDAKNPVDRVNWDDAQNFCKTLSASTGKIVRLPSEAQWEYACRAGSTTAYGFGDDAETLGDYAWCHVNSKDTTHPVGQKKPNAWKLYDMHGSLWEWCNDLYDQTYYSESPKVDPPGPEKGNGSHVLRGGSWYVSAWDCRSAYRYWGWPGWRECYNGFRVVVSASDKDIGCKPLRTGVIYEPTDVPSLADRREECLLAASEFQLYFEPEKTMWRTR
jgi:formylglycine-generating enzyme required for sulfatase activity